MTSSRTSQQSQEESVLDHAQVYMSMVRCSLEDSLDFVREMYYNSPAMKLVKELMTRSLLTVTPDTTVKDVILLLLRHRITGAPVVRDDGTMLGMITESDLVYRIKLPEFKDLLHQVGAYCDPRPLIGKFRKICGSTVKEVMNTHVVSIAENATLGELVDLTVESDLNPIPVMRGKRLVGIVSRSDIMKVLVEKELELELAPLSDDEVTDLVTTVLKKNICAPIRDLHVRTTNGLVTLSGEIEAKEALPLIEETVKSIRGVKNVHVDLLVAPLLE